MGGRINRTLVMTDRERAGLEAFSTAAVLDGRGVETTQSGGPRGDDAGCAGDKPAAAPIIAVEIVRKPNDQVGFAVPPRRRVVERFHGRIRRNRRLWKDPEATLASAKAVLYAAAVMILVRRLGRTA